MKKLLLVAVGLILLLGAGCTSTVTSSPSTTPTPVTTPTAAAPGEHCGGNIASALGCTAGYHCAPSADSHLPFGDVGGVCVID